MFQPVHEAPAIPYLVPAADALLVDRAGLSNDLAIIRRFNPLGSGEASARVKELAPVFGHAGLPGSGAMIAAILLHLPNKWSGLSCAFFNAA